MATKLKGFKSLGRKITRLSNMNVRQPAVKAVRDVVLPQAKADTPVVEGRLQKSINIVSIRKIEGSKGVSIAIGPRSRKKGKDPAVYGPIVESYTPFLAPSVADSKREAIRALAGEIRQKMKQAAK